MNPKVKAALAKEVVIDQPCCVFEPRIVPVADGQVLVVKNSAGIAHNTKIDGGELGPTVSAIMPAQPKQEFRAIKPRLDPIPFACSIHAWMKGYIIAVPNP